MQMIPSFEVFVGNRRKAEVSFDSTLLLHEKDKASQGIFFKREKSDSRPQFPKRFIWT